MYSEAWSWPTTTAIVSLNSLGWFLLGILAGRRIRRKTAGSQQQQQGRQTSRAQAQQRRGEASGSSAELYVGNLSYEMTEEELRDLFSKAGKVASVRLIGNKFNGKSKGYAFIEMAGEAQAIEASRQFNGKEIKGRKMVVSQAKSKAR